MSRLAESYVSLGSKVKIRFFDSKFPNKKEESKAVGWGVSESPSQNSV